MLFDVCLWSGTWSLEGVSEQRGMSISDVAFLELARGCHSPLNAVQHATVEEHSGMLHIRRWRETWLRMGKNDVMRIVFLEEGEGSR